MYQSIGEVYLQTIFRVKVPPSNQSLHEAYPINMPYSIVSNTNKRLQDAEIRGYVFNDTNKTQTEYIADLNALTGRCAAYNRTQFEGIDGYLEVDGIEIRNTLSELNTYIIYAKYLPISNYCSYYQYQQTIMKHSFTSLFPAYFTLPFGVEKFELSNRYKERSIYSKITNIVTPEGSLPVFSYPDWINAGSCITTGTMVPSDGVKYEAVTLDTPLQYIKWSVFPGMDNFAGNIEVSANCKVVNGASGTINIAVVDSNDAIQFSTNYIITNTNFAYVRTPKIMLNPYERYELYVYNVAGEVTIDGIRIKNVEAKEYIKFVPPAPAMNKGECKVYDTVTIGQRDATKWKRVYAQHTFSGEIVFENATAQWIVKPNATWETTGIFVDRVSNTLGTLYPYDFNTTIVDLNIVDIKPDSIVAIINLRNSTGMNKVVVNITPLRMYFRVTPRMVYHSDYDWGLDMAEYESVGVLNDRVNSMVLFTATSSITMARSKLIGTNIGYGSMFSFDSGDMNDEYTFVVSVLPRVTYNVDATHLVTAIDGDDYYVDGEFIDTTKNIYLSDFINSVYESGLMVNMNIAHRSYGDDKW